VTVIIPARPGQADVPAAEAARALSYPQDRLEVLIARGRQPSAQRNLALRRAKGELIYFLDDDAVPDPGNLQRALMHFSNARVQMVGGPSLCPASAPFLEQAFGVTLASWLAFGPSRARYSAIGQPRESGEKELILCNLLARRQAVLDLGGFDEALYPNEENALMDSLVKSRGVLMYDPAVAIDRRPRPTLRAFARMAFTYGRGRAEQFRLHPTAGSIANFVPPLFVLFLLMMPILGGLGVVLLIPYFVALFLQGAASVLRSGLVTGLLSIPLVSLVHLSYGLGFWRGLFTQVAGKRDSAQTEGIQIEQR